MTDSTSDPHLGDALGLYLLGALGPRERGEVERHLGRCPACQVECDQLGEVVAALALLSEEEGREVVAEFGIHPASARSSASSPASASASSPAPARSPASASSKAEPLTRTIRAPRRTRALLSIAALVVVLLLSVGAIVGLSLSGSGSDATPVPITLAATAADTSTGATVSVVAAGHDGRVTIRATVTGLHAGTKYQLYAVTSDGATHVVTSWTATDVPQDVTGDLAVSPRSLSFFTVTLSDSTPVVSAYIK